jgi:hypothetical protein
LRHDVTHHVVFVALLPRARPPFCLRHCPPYCFTSHYWLLPSCYGNRCKQTPYAYSMHVTIYIHMWVFPPWIFCMLLSLLHFGMKFVSWCHFQCMKYTAINFFFYIYI